jgi:hypothetical protein
MAISDTKIAIGCVAEPPQIITFDLKPALPGEGTAATGGTGRLTPGAGKTDIKHQIRSIALKKFGPTVEYQMVGTIFGEVELTGKAKTIIKSHWNEQQGTVHAVNSVAICPHLPGGLSVGSDGQLVHYNLETLKQGRTIKMSQQGFPLTAVAISSKGEVAAIAQGYDWSRGAEAYHGPDTVPIGIYIKRLTASEFG